MAVYERLGLKWNLNDQDKLQHRLIASGVHEKQDTEKLLSILQPRSTAIDVGANCGYYSLLASKICKTVYSFEPYPSTYKQLIDNIKLNHIQNIKAYKLALGHKTETSFYGQLDPSNSGGFSMLNKKESGIKIDTITLDQFVAGYNVKQVDFIKLDVEGFEINVLFGALKTIETFHPKIMIEFLENDSLKISSVIVRLFEHFGYKLYTVQNQEFIPFKLTTFPLHTNVWCL